MDDVDAGESRGDKAETCFSTMDRFLNHFRAGSDTVRNPETDDLRIKQPAAGH